MATWTQLTHRSLPLADKFHLIKELWDGLVDGEACGKRVCLVQSTCDLLIDYYNKNHHLAVHEPSSDDAVPSNDHESVTININDVWSYLNDCMMLLNQSQSTCCQWIVYTRPFIKTLSLAYGVAAGPDGMDVLCKCLEMLLLWEPTPSPVMCYSTMLPLTANVLQACIHHKNFKIIEPLLNHMCYLQSIHSNSKKVYISICEHLLVSLFRLKLITKDNLSLCDSIKNMITHLFARDHLMEYVSLLSFESTQGSSSVSMVTGNYTRHLFECLNRVTPPPSMTSLLRFIMDLMLEQNRSSMKLTHKHEFMFLLKLMRLMDVNVTTVTITKKKSDDNENNDIEGETVKDDSHGVDGLTFDGWVECNNVIESIIDDGIVHHNEMMMDQPTTAGVIYQLLLKMKEYGIYQIVEDASDGHDMLYSLQHLVAIIIERFSTNMFADCFKCLEVLIKVNHVIVEPVLSSLWKLILSVNIDGLVTDESSKSVIGFADSVVSIYGKLHQIPKLITFIIASIRDFPYKERCVDLKSVFFVSTQKILKSILKDCLGSQLIELIQLVLDELTVVFVSKMDGLTDCVPIKKKKKRRSCSDASINSDNVIVCMHWLIDIIETFLFSFPLDVCVTGRHLQTLHSLLYKLIKEVYLPLKEATINKVCVRCVWVHLHLVLYHWKCLNGEAITGGEAGDDDIWRGEEIKEINWSRDSMNIVEWEDGEESSSLTTPLIEYLLRFVYIIEVKFSAISSCDDEIMEHVLVKPSSPAQCDSWNGQILNVKSANMYTAIWSTILQHVSYLYSRFDKFSDVLNLFMSDAIITILCIGAGSGLCDVIRDHMTSEHYQDLKLLQGSLFGRIMQKLSSVWPKKVCREVKGVLDYPLAASAIALPVCEDVIKSSKLKKFLIYSSNYLMVFKMMRFKSCDGHMISIIKGLLQLSVALIVACIGGGDCLNDNEVVVHVCLVLGRCLKEFLHWIANQKKSTREKCPLNTLNVFEMLMWFQGAGGILDNHGDDVHGGLLIVMEALLQWWLMMEPHSPNASMLTKGMNNKSQFMKRWKLLLTHNTSQHITTDSLNKSQDDDDDDDVIMSLDVKFPIGHWLQPLPLIVSVIEAEGVVPSWMKLQEMVARCCRDDGFLDYLLVNDNVMSRGSFDGWKRHVLYKGWVEKGEESWLSWYRVVTCVQRGIQCLLDTCHVTDVISISNYIIDNLSSSWDVSISDKLCFCLCWKLILNCTFSHEKRTVIHPILEKVALKCCYLVTVATNSVAMPTETTHEKSNKLIMLYSLSVLHQLTSIPHKGMGLNRQAVLLSFHGLAAVNDALLLDLKIMKAGQYLLLSIVRTHSHAICESHGPMLGVTLKLLKGLITAGRQPFNNDISSELKLCISVMSRIFEMLVREVWFTKYAVHCVGQYIIASQVSPLNPIFKQLMVQGVLVLMKSLTPKDIILMKSSLDEGGKSVLMDLIQYYNKFYKFTGKI